MKRCLGLLPSLLILAVLLLFCLWTGRRVGTDTERWRAPLIQSSEAALLGEVEDAEAMYRRARAFLDGQETEEYRAELADLIHQLLALAEQEALSWENVL